MGGHADGVTCKRCTLTREAGIHSPADKCGGCMAPGDHHTFDPVDPHGLVRAALEEVVMALEPSDFGPGLLALADAYGVALEAEEQD